MSSLWDVPQYLIMAFSLASPAPDGKASRVSLSPPQKTVAADFARPGDRISDDMWLRTMKAAAPASDVLSAYASRIFVTSAGRYYVPVAAERGEILKLKDNAEVAIRVTAAATVTYAEHLARQTGGRVSRGALLVAHVAGLKTAAAYALGLKRDPSARAAMAVPALAPLISSAGMSLAALDRRLAAALGETSTQMANAGPAGPGPLKGSVDTNDGHRASARALASAD